MKNYKLIPSVLWLVTMVWLMQINRTEFILLWSLYSIAFGAYIWLVIHQGPIAIRNGLILALLARLASFFFDPLLSDDFYRFIWDGMLVNNGIHPMAYTPTYLITHPEILHVNQTLYEALNSPDYFSVYPPLSQWIFSLSYLISGPNLLANVLCYKTVLLVTDSTIIILLYKLLLKRNLPSDRVLFYALNPLIVIEFVGNLHMDGIMIVGLLAAVLMVEKNNLSVSILAMALSILSKMLTLVLLPFMPKSIYPRKILWYALITTGFSVLIFWLSFGAHTSWLQSIRLWFQTFEFNAGLYYLVRYAGMLIKGYNLISITGPALAACFLLGTCLLWVKYRGDVSFDWAHAMLFVLTLYFFCATTIHPWYLGILLVLSILSQHVYPIVWTYLVFLSYSHYQDGGYAENYWLIATEYLLLAAFILWEWLQKRPLKHLTA